VFPMSWLILSVLTAVSEAAKDIFSKKSLRSSNAYLVAWAYRLYSLPFLLPLLFIIEIPVLTANFWLAMVVGGGLNVITTILYMKALSHSDISLTVPMVAFTPLFLLVTSPVIVGEFPTFAGFVGVILIVLGSYFLNIKEIKKGFWAPFRSLVYEKGPRYMLLVAFIWSITSNFDKMGVKASSPLFWAVSVNVFIALAMTPIVLLRVRRNAPEMVTRWRKYLPIGLLGAATLIFQMLAINITLVAYVISIKRTSAVLVVLAGYWFFKEKGTASRLVGSLIMLAGVLLISIF